MKFQVKELLSRIGADQEKGQTLIEYALIILLVSIVVMVVLAALGVIKKKGRL
jgi:Flp pilus assembly pilin Flp